MIRGIDHLVIACEDPDGAARDLESSLGIRCTAGGRHPNAGTWNRLAWLADGSYLELIGIADAEQASRNPVGAATLAALDQHGGGLATYALLDDALELTVAALRAADSSIGPASHGSRVRDDGETVEWWTAVPGRSLAPSAPPFLIQHAYAGAEWGPAAMEERKAFAHPIGSPVILARLDVATSDPPSAAALLHEDVGLDLWTVADLAVADIGPHVLRLVPVREMAVPAVVTLGAHVETPRTADLLGLRFDVERVEIPVPTSGRG
jgi:hypothetical protein